MSKEKTTIAVVVTLLIAGSTFYLGSRKATVDYLVARFPELNIDRKLAYRVHNEMTRESLFQKYANLEMNEETYNTIFLSKYKQLTK